MSSPLSGLKAGFEVGLLSIVLILACSAPDQPVEKPFDVEKARKEAAHRKRRIIMNNDGNDCRADREGEPHTAEAMLARRSTPLAGSQVDAIFYCTGVFDLYTNESEETELHVTAPNNERFWADELIARGRDPLRIMIDFGHSEGLEVFWSMRMNDTHDSNPSYAMLMSRWKRNHPDLMMAPEQKRFPYGGRRWSAVDYGKAEVREKVFRILRDVATRYDVDGLELDFFRHPVYFRPQMTGDPVLEEHCNMMTALLTRIRRMADEVGKARRRPILITARVPDSVSFARAIGLDLIRWMEEGLVDMLTGGGYLHLEPWENWAALGKKYGVPVYACLSGSRLVDPGRPEGKEDLELWRGEALRAWDAGVAGIYTFNRFDPESPLFRELGDPKLLETLPRRYVFIPEGRGHLKSWLEGGASYVAPDVRNERGSGLEL